jgi:hypothetical protein
MLRLARGALGTLSRMWLNSDWSSSAVPKPVGDTSISTAGARPARVLLVGAGVALGLGVRSHELALAGHLARALTARTGRAIDIDVVTDRSMTLAASLDVVAALPVARYDAVITTLGLLDALVFVDPEEWERDLRALLARLRDAGRDDTEVFVVAVPPLRALRRYPFPLGRLANRGAQTLNRRSIELVAGFERATFLPFDPCAELDVDRFRSPGTYARWAELLAPAIAARLCAGRAGDVTPGEAPPDAVRSASLEGLHILDTEPEERFDRIASTARDLLGTEAAAITFADADRHWFKARVGITARQVPRTSSLSDATLQRRESFWVEDASTDPRFAHGAGVLGGPHIRFYAGYPITAPDGVTVGSLCVFDSQPRQFSDADAALLRALALMVQNELRVPVRSGPRSD